MEKTNSTNNNDKKSICYIIPKSLKHISKEELHKIIDSPTSSKKEAEEKIQEITSEPSNTICLESRQNIKENINQVVCIMLLHKFL